MWRTTNEANRIGFNIQEISVNHYSYSQETANLYIQTAVSIFVVIMKQFCPKSVKAFLPSCLLQQSYPFRRPLMSHKALFQESQKLYFLSPFRGYNAFSGKLKLIHMASGAKL